MQNGIKKINIATASYDTVAREIKKVAAAKPEAGYFDFSDAAVQGTYENVKKHMYRNQAADLQIGPEDISEEYIANSKILLISGTALAASPSREACLLAVKYAKENNVKIIFDIDYREYTWQSKEEISVYYSMDKR